MQWGVALGFSAAGGDPSFGGSSHPPPPTNSQSRPPGVHHSEARLDRSTAVKGNDQKLSFLRGEKVWVCLAISADVSIPVEFGHFSPVFRFRRIQLGSRPDPAGPTPPHLWKKKGAERHVALIIPVITIPRYRRWHKNYLFLTTRKPIERCHAKVCAERSLGGVGGHPQLIYFPSSSSPSQPPANKLPLLAQSGVWDPPGTKFFLPWRFVPVFYVFYLFFLLLICWEKIPENALFGIFFEPPPLGDVVASQPTVL